MIVENRYKSVHDMLNNFFEGIGHGKFQASIKSEYRVKVGKMIMARYYEVFICLGALLSRLSPRVVLAYFLFYETHTPGSRDRCTYR